MKRIEHSVIVRCSREFPGGLALKDLALSLLWQELDPWTRELLHAVGSAKKKKKKKKKPTKVLKLVISSCPHTSRDVFVLIKWVGESFLDEEKRTWEEQKRQGYGYKYQNIF